MSPESPMKIDGHWDIRYKYSAGPAATRFFQALRDEGIILASPCSSCDRVLLPPRTFCERCFVETSDMIPVGPRGFVETFTMNYSSDVVSADRPTVIALIRLDGASTNIAHYLAEVPSDPEVLFQQVQAGMRVEAEFEAPERRSGGLLDIRYFRPVEEA